jgi:hypothetical protein
VELDAPAVARSERLDAVFVRGEFGGVRREFDDRVAVGGEDGERPVDPIEQSAVGVVVNLVVADLVAVHRRDTTAQRRREQLVAETHTQHREPGVGGVGDPLDGRTDPRLVVVDGRRRAGDDRGVELTGTGVAGGRGVDRRGEVTVGGVELDERRVQLPSEVPCRVCVLV